MERTVQLMLVQGRIPTPMQGMIGAMLPKATAGYRSVVLFPSLYRVVMKAAKPGMAMWQNRREEAHLSFVKGKSMTNIVAAQLIEAEQASNEGMHHAATMWDLSNFYEAMDRNTLQARHRSTGFPSHLSTLTRSMYGCRRLFRSGEIIVDGGCPTRGIPAGCAAATYHVQAYLSDDAADWAQSNPDLGLNIHIDDITMYATAQTPDDVANKLAHGLVEMKEILEQRWGCELAWPKVATVTSNEATRQALERKLSTLIGPRKQTATNLVLRAQRGVPEPE